MRSVGSYEAKTHLPRLLDRVERGETITITKHGRPVAILGPVRPGPGGDVRAIIAEFQAYSRERACTLAGLSVREMIEEGRP